MEFMSRANTLIWGEDNEYTPEDAKKSLEKLGYCRIPVKTGTLAVFSNYQLVHRVLRMEFPPDGSSEMGCRDFLALFIVDQRAPLTSTKEFTAHREAEEQENLRKKLFID